MISKSEHPVAWGVLMYQLEDAHEHLSDLIREMSTGSDVGEPELRVNLGHIYAHLNRFWNARNIVESLSEEQWHSMRTFPADLEPIA